MYDYGKQILPSGKRGLRDRSIIRLVRISLSEVPNSLRRKLVGIRPAAAAFCL